MNGKKKYDLELKKRIVAEYIASGDAAAIAAREGLERGQIYRWKYQLEQRGKIERVEQIQAEDPSLSYEQARKIRELEEELAETQKMLAQVVLENGLLKKLHPNFQQEKRSSGYIETKQLLARSKGRAK